VKFNYMPLFVDIAFSLRCLERGVPVRISNKLCQETPAMAKTAKVGGCGEYREKLVKTYGSQIEVNRAMSGVLQKIFPEFVTLNPDKKAMSRLHRIAWKNAYIHGQTARRAK
jgi:hypothetical protein